MMNSLAISHLPTCFAAIAPARAGGIGWTVVAGILAGFVLGFLGAGGGVVALPVFLLLAGLAPHLTLGTNAFGVGFLAAALFLWQTRQASLPVRRGILFAAFGGPAIYLGAHLGLLYPGRKLIFLLGVLLFAVAAWMVYLSYRRPQRPAGAGPAEDAPSVRLGFTRTTLIAAMACVTGLTAGFFGVAGGFLIVPALMLAGGLDLSFAAALALLPIAVFSGIVGIAYWSAGDVNLTWALLMLAAGIPAGSFGIWLSRRLSNRVMLRVFATFLAALGLYMGWARFSTFFR
jgi:uncharacterized membrane protein YfcA